MAKKIEFETYVTARCSETIKTALEEFAREEKRSLSNYIRVVLEKHVEDAEKRGKSRKAA